MAAQKSQKSLEQRLSPLSKEEIKAEYNKKFKGVPWFWKRFNKFYVPPQKQNLGDVIPREEIDLMYCQFNAGYNLLRQKSKLRRDNDSAKITRKQILEYIFVNEARHVKAKQVLLYHGCRTVEELVGRFPGMNIPDVNHKEPGTERKEPCTGGKQEHKKYLAVSWDPENVPEIISKKQLRVIYNSHYAWYNFKRNHSDLFSNDTLYTKNFLRKCLVHPNMIYKKRKELLPAFGCTTVKEFFGFAESYCKKKEVEVSHAKKMLEKTKTDSLYSFIRSKEIAGKA